MRIKRTIAQGGAGAAIGAIVSVLAIFNLDTHFKVLTPVIQTQIQCMVERALGADPLSEKCRREIDIAR